MPAIPTTAYATAGSVLALARAIIDDSYSVSGQILTGSVPGPAAPMTYQYVNSAYRYLQNELTNSGVELWVAQAIITGLTATPVTDPSTQVSLSDSGYFDGQNNFTSPQLPTLLLRPLRIWERMTGNPIQAFTEMRQANDGLPQIMNTAKFGYWEWRQDALYMPGATQSNDLRVRYNQILPSVAVDTDPIQIRNSIDAMAYLTAWSYAITSGDAMIAETVMKAAMGFIEQIITLYVRGQQRGSHRRASYSRRASRGILRNW